MSVTELSQEDGQLSDFDIISFLSRKREWEKLKPQNDGLDAARGLMWGLLFAAPCWGVILWLILR